MARQEVTVLRSEPFELGRDPHRPVVDRRCAGEDVPVGAHQPVSRPIPSEGVTRLESCLDLRACSGGVVEESPGRCRERRPVSSPRTRPGRPARTLGRVRTGRTPRRCRDAPPRRGRTRTRRPNWYRAPAPRGRAASCDRPPSRSGDHAVLWRRRSATRRVAWCRTGPRSRRARGRGRTPAAVVRAMRRSRRHGCDRRSSSLRRAGTIGRRCRARTDPGRARAGGPGPR